MTSPGGEQVPDQVLREIGRITTTFGVLELFVNAVLRRFTGLDDHVAAILFMGDPIGRQLDRLRGIVSGAEPTLDAWIDEVSELSARRNEVVHAAWFEDDKASEEEGVLLPGETAAGYTLRIKRRSVDLIEQRFTIEELSRLADRIEAASDQAGLIVLALMGFFEGRQGEA